MIELDYKENKIYKKLRVVIDDLDNEYIYCSAGLKKIKVSLDNHFSNSKKILQKGSQLNLINFHINSDKICSSEIIIFEPDYLIDISSLADCFKSYGKSELNYIISRFSHSGNSKPLLLGNTVNFFLDELIYTNDKVDFENSIKKVFKKNSLKFSTCKQIQNNDNFKDFISESKHHFDNLFVTIEKKFPKLNINKNKAILEPSFICENLGVQGRLDFLEYDSTDNKCIIVELKSGKPPFPYNNTTLIAENHAAQAIIYSYMIQNVLNVENKYIKTYILYSNPKICDHPLREVNTDLIQLNKIIEIRNLIVYNEISISRAKNYHYLENIIQSISYENLIKNPNRNSNFIELYIKPNIDSFRDIFQRSSSLELKYFYSFSHLTIRELFLAKTGSVKNNFSYSSLWNLSNQEKINSGNIITNLSIIRNDINLDIPTILLDRKNYKGLSSFRKGDIVILYEKNFAQDNVTSKQIFKGSITKIDNSEIEILFRLKQSKKDILNHNSTYAIEPDFLDTNYISMLKGLYSFLYATEQRKHTILNQNKLSSNLSIKLSCEVEHKEIEDIILKAKQAEELFMIVGPPGSGKTSRVLKCLTKEFYHSNDSVLILSFTNRATDEICETLEKIPNIDYVRIGTEASLDLRFKHRDFSKIIENCKKRKEILDILQNKKIYVGTVSSILSKINIFDVKQFEVAIIDEASQILEANLVGVLCAKHKDQNAIKKFILIGDHRQLPAVSILGDQDSKIEDKDLNQIGVTSYKESFFERMFNTYHLDKKICTILTKTGRMHPEILDFSSKNFYNNKLISAGLPDQNNSYVFFRIYQNKFQEFLASNKVAFFNHNSIENLSKRNHYEAELTKNITENIFNLFKLNKKEFYPYKSFGIITPFRNQIALIQQKISELNIPELNDITIDSVERFQGSERDIILFCFCVNSIEDIELISNKKVIESQLVDKKLNVVLTRARKHLFIVGNQNILSNDLVYKNLINNINCYR